MKAIAGILITEHANGRVTIENQFQSDGPMSPAMQQVYRDYCAAMADFMLTYGRTVAVEPGRAVVGVGR